MRARFWSFFYLFPGLRLPPKNLLFVSSHLAQDSPDVTRMIAHPRHITDKLCHARQGPQIRRVPLSTRPTKQFLLDQRQLFLLQSGLPSSSRGAFQSSRVAAVPCLPPFADALATDPQVQSHRGRPFALFEECDGFLAAFA